jgi:lipoprotein NlpD
VVYAGSGLKGYGNLLIIKHNEYYLSAYGHNSKLLVKEGDKVRSGQQIARIGDTGTNEFKLHFEIRRDGKPVDPLKLLPKK